MKKKKGSTIPPFHRALAKFLGQHGWNVLATGESRVTKRGALMLNFTFEMDFIGVKQMKKMKT